MRKVVNRPFFVSQDVKKEGVLFYGIKEDFGKREGELNEKKNDQCVDCLRTEMGLGWLAIVYVILHPGAYLPQGKQGSIFQGGGAASKAGSAIAE